WHSLQREHRGQRLLFDSSRLEDRHLVRADGKTHKSGAPTRGSTMAKRKNQSSKVQNIEIQRVDVELLGSMIVFILRCNTPTSQLPEHTSDYFQRANLTRLVEDPDALFSEYRQRGVECNPNSVHDTSWGTREFALYDLDRNALTFYRFD